jgi:hypothetical protein
MCGGERWPVAAIADSRASAAARDEPLDIPDYFEGGVRARWNRILLW